MSVASLRTVNTWPNKATVALPSAVSPARSDSVAMASSPSSSTRASGPKLNPAGRDSRAPPLSVRVAWLTSRLAVSNWPASLTRSVPPLTSAPPLRRSGARIALLPTLPSVAASVAMRRVPPSSATRPSTVRRAVAAAVGLATTSPDRSRLARRSAPPKRALAPLATTSAGLASSRASPSVSSTAPPPSVSLGVLRLPPPLMRNWPPSTLLLPLTSSGAATRLSPMLLKLTVPRRVNSLPLLSTELPLTLNSPAPASVPLSRIDRMLALCPRRSVAPLSTSTRLSMPSVLAPVITKVPPLTRNSPLPLPVPPNSTAPPPSLTKLPEPVTAPLKRPLPSPGLTTVKVCVPRSSKAEPSATCPVLSLTLTSVSSPPSPKLPLLPICRRIWSDSRALPKVLTLPWSISSVPLKGLTPASVRPPAPLLVSVTALLLPATAPRSVKVLPASTLMDPPPSPTRTPRVAARSVEPAAPPRSSSAPPSRRNWLSTAKSGATPRLLSARIAMLPPRIAVLPVKVLLPASVQRPAPVLTKPPVPEITPSKPASAGLAPTLRVLAPSRRLASRPPLSEPSVAGSSSSSTGAAPGTITTAPLAGKAAPASPPCSSKRPATMRVPPLKLLTPDSSTVPGPVLLNPAGPANAASTTPDWSARLLALRPPLVPALSLMLPASRLTPSTVWRVPARSSVPPATLSSPLLGSTPSAPNSKLPALTFVPPL